MKGTAVDKICDAMLELLQEAPLEKISVKELTARADVNRSSYSYHFYDKEEVLEAIYRRFNMGLGAIFFRGFSREAEPPVSLREFKRAVLKHYYEHRDEVKILRGAGFGAEFDRRFLLTLEELFHQLDFTVRDGEGREFRMEGETYDLKIRHIVHDILGDIEYWASYNSRIGLDEMVDLSCRAEEVLLEKVAFRTHGVRRR